jgi:hypothetical protein
MSNGCLRVSGRLKQHHLGVADGLLEVGVATGSGLEYEGVSARVALPEYLVALYLQPQAQTLKRRERAARLAEWPGLNRGRLDAILKRHGLSL